MLENEGTESEMVLDKKHPEIQGDIFVEEEGGVEDTAGNHAISAETGKEGTESEEFITGNYNGAWQTAAKIVSLSYLWNVIRVQGGAYGTGMLTRPNGGL